MKKGNATLSRFSFLMAFSSLFFSCHTAKKVQKDSNIVKTDSSKTKEKVKVFDSAAWAKNILDSSISQELHFKTFSGKMSFAINSIQLNQTANANLRIADDSLIWMSLTGPFGIEGGRAKITRDSIVILDKIHSTVTYRPIEYLQQIAQAPINYALMQNLLFGHFLFSKEDFSKFLWLGNDLLQLDFVKGNISCQSQVNIANGNITQTKLSDASHPEYQCLIEYDAFEKTNNGVFPKNIKITVTGKINLKVELKTKDYKIDPQQDYPFNVSSKYSIK